MLKISSSASWLHLQLLISPNSSPMLRWEIYHPAPRIQNHFIKTFFCLMAFFCQRAGVACIGSWPHALYLLSPANAIRSGLRALVPASWLNFRLQQSRTLASSPSLGLPLSIEGKVFSLLCLTCVAWLRWLRRAAVV